MTSGVSIAWSVRKKLNPRSNPSIRKVQHHLAYMTVGNTYQAGVCCQDLTHGQPFMSSRILQQIVACSAVHGSCESAVSRLGRSHMDLDDLERRARYPIVDAHGNIKVLGAVGKHGVMSMPLQAGALGQ